MSGILPNPKGQRCALCQTFQCHNVMFTITFFRKKCFYILSPYKSQWCVKGQNICMHGGICFILIDLIMQHDYFQKRKQINLFSVSVRVKHLLICYCKLLLFDKQHDHILIKLILFLSGGIFAPGAEFEKIYFLYGALVALLFSGVEPLCNFG